MAFPGAMKLPPPRALLLFLLLVAAAGIAGGGLRLAAREETRRIQRDREALRQFSMDAQDELRRLDALYEEHLRRLAVSVSLTDTFEIRKAAASYIGILQVAVLHSEPDPKRDLLAHASAHSGIPAPVFQKPEGGLPARHVLISKERVFDGGQPSGWIEEPAKPLMFWLRRSDQQAVVLTIDPDAVEKAISEWLVPWAAAPFKNVAAGPGADAFRDSKNRLLASVSSPPPEPQDVLLPLRSRFGRWEAASWDRREKRVVYHAPTLAGMMGLALLVAGVGGWTFVQQTRAARVAEQRVSFVNRVSHELRSPLTNILLNLDLATDALPTESEDAGRRLGLVREEARRLTRLVDNVLSFSRSEQGKLTFSPQPCHPQALVAAVLDQFAAGFRRRGLEILNESEAAEARVLDSDAVAQVLSNLLSNVEKYVPGGLVTISSQVEADTLRIVVADQGPGIPAREAERIFRPFERLTDNVNEGSSGTGLGLAIARDLARGMGGHLRLLPTKTGATFELLVPAPAAPLPGFSHHPPAV